MGDLSIGTSTATSTTQQILCLNGSCITSFPWAIFASSSATSTATTSPTFAPGFLAALKSAISSWLADTGNGITDLFAKNITATNATADNITANQKLCVGTTCVTPAQFQAMVNAYMNSQAGSGSSSGTGGSESSGSGTSTPPTISVSGDNPATVNTGDTYSDLGATITGPSGDLNLGIDASVDGGATTTVSAIQIDTTAAGTHTITYSVTDQNGLTGTATRTVNVVDPDASSTNP